ncbi:chromosome segregation protein SMC [Streptococcus caviae]|uniref:chromosome segregation protein SMC n=1 Tax=Streptococcus sp. 'caviae' TaxID=1915004 RepID=UPI00094BB28A|nr:chromosome segregation protein SMC [Streptococcus sp. 'caviae']OLN84235.1 chromosome segregation protein SMC [Streptococcus sp. 'caviae']
MFLKEIEMQGFKSFADKTKVEFDRGVTAVVGPNGSGKSNITESLRWALGESSAKSLRGGKMPDVIFAGTENRKPLNYAQVTVVLDNSDAFIKNAQEEIRVERHIYRNGDSDYLIDGKKVRLRDIHDLFMDTGLGRDSFSIISQGRVEEIFNSKPEERRAIFEEAAGVLKYKTRKKETESKLNQTQDNLDRLDDIIYELETQIKPLEKQAKTAEEFLVLEAERKEKHLDLLVYQILNHKEQLEDQQGRLKAVKQDLQTYYQEREQLETKNQQLKGKRHNLSQQIDQKQAELLEVTRLISDYERQIELIKLESSQKAEKKQSTQERLSQLTEQKVALKDEIAEKEHKLADLETQSQQKKQAIVDLETELSRFSTDPDQMIENLREDFVRLMQDEADVSNQLTILKAEIDSQKQESENKTAEVQQLKADLDETDQRAAKEAEVLKAAKDKVQKLLADYQKAAQLVQNLEADYNQQQDLMFTLLDELKDKRARKHSLESILKSHSNFYAGVRSVLQRADQIQGIIGAVSEHLTFDKKYQTALEIALGGSSQNIIVEDEAAAKRSIDFLKRNRQGRATFLPLTTIKPRRLSEQHQTILTSSQGFLGLARDLVSFDDRLTGIFGNLLGITAIFDSVDHANQAARKLRYQVRLVTLDGTEIRPGGSFSGGASRQNNSTFIKPELDSLTKELAALEDRQSQQENKVSQAKQALDEQRAGLLELREEGNQARLSEQKAELEYQQLQARLEEQRLLYQQLTQADRLDSTLNLEKEQTNLETKLEKIAAAKEKLSQEIAQFKEDKDSIQQKTADLSQELSALRLSERDLANTERFEKSNLNRLLADLSELEKNEANMTQLLSSQEEDLDEHRLPRLEEQLTASQVKKADSAKALVRYRFELEDCEAQLEEIEASLLKANEKNEALIRSQTQLEVKIDQLSDQLRHFAGNLAEDYQLSLDEAKKQAQAVDNPEAAKTHLRQLEKQIKRLGPVNLDAIGQYEEVSERLQFLNGQKDDLVRAKDLLLSTIHDMDNEVKARFKTTFEAIRESFKTTFTQMFGGGSADLLLTEGDLLTAGIDISVQPPGKKIQSLNLMSGGEKALSALALLFAIIRVKTIPFVILDEVEAALDEANVKRFGDYLNRFDKSSQFIVVTHRKGTMSAADSIYGVTMQESGVSKIVSVKLKEADSVLQD